MRTQSSTLHFLFLQAQLLGGVVYLARLQHHDGLIMLGLLLLRALSLLLGLGCLRGDSGDILRFCTLSR